jgi:DNA-binding NarL/FixJ family response regulator
MERFPNRLNLLIAQAMGSEWATDLACTLSRHPVDLHWSATDAETVRLAVSGGMHVAVVDDGLPDTGGLDVLRRIRQLGLDFPCLLVCDDPDPRLLRDALALDVFSVVQAEAGAKLLAPMVIKIVRRVYHVDWPGANRLN